MPIPASPDPSALHPIPGYGKLIFLANAITRPNISVGRFTCYDASGTPGRRAEDFETDNVLYHFDFIGDRLIIGSFRAIASGARFLMNGGTTPWTGYPPILSASSAAGRRLVARPAAGGTPWWAVTSGSAIAPRSSPASLSGMARWSPPGAW